MATATALEALETSQGAEGAIWEGGQAGLESRRGNPVARWGRKQSENLGGH